MTHSEKMQWNCLWGAHIQDVAKRLPRLVKAEDYHLLLLFHVGSNDAGTEIPKYQKRLQVPQKEVERIWSTHSVLFNPPGKGLGLRESEMSGWGERLAA